MKSEEELFEMHYKFLKSEEYNEKYKNNVSKGAKIIDEKQKKILIKELYNLQHNNPPNSIEDILKSIYENDYINYICRHFYGYIKSIICEILRTAEIAIISDFYLKLQLDDIWRKKLDQYKHLDYLLDMSEFYSDDMAKLYKQKSASAVRQKIQRIKYDLEDLGIFEYLEIKRNNRQWIKIISDFYYKDYFRPTEMLEEIKGINNENKSNKCHLTREDIEFEINLRNDIRKNSKNIYYDLFKK